MKSKPLPILILAFLYLAAPIANTFVSAWLMGLSMPRYLFLLLATRGHADLFLLLIVPMVAAASIYMVRKWSYGVFLFVAIIQIYSNVQTSWHLHSHSTLLLAVHALNIAIVGYFLLPAVRAPYLDHRLRWWEQCPRYHVSIGAIVLAADSAQTLLSRCKILNISEGGVLIKTNQRLATQDHLRVVFNHLGFSLELNGHAVHSREDGGWIYGIQFEPKTMKKTERLNLIGLVRTLDIYGVNTLREKPSVLRDIKNYLTPRDSKKKTAA